MATKLFHKYSVVDGINRNILDNAYFVGGGSQLNTGAKFPVNQRHQSSYSSNGYSIDRWILSNNAELTFVSDAIKLKNTSSGSSSYMTQKLEFPLNAPVTFSALARVDLKAAASADAGAFRISLRDSSNNELTNAGVSVSSTSTTVLVSGTYTGSTPVAQFLLVLTSSVPLNAYAEIIACKLETGKHQTLAHRENGAWVLNETPNPTDEWLRCQRYYHYYYHRPYRDSDKWYDQHPPMRVDPTVTEGTTWAIFDADL